MERLVDEKSKKYDDADILSDIQNDAIDTTTRVFFPSKNYAVSVSVVCDFIKDVCRFAKNYRTVINKVSARKLLGPPVSILVGLDDNLSEVISNRSKD